MSDGRGEADARNADALAYVDKSIDNVAGLDADIVWRNDEVVKVLDDVRAMLLGAGPDAEPVAESDDVVGHVVISVPVFRIEDGGGIDSGPEIWLTYGEATLLRHDLSTHNLGWLGNEIRHGDVMANFEMPPRLLADADAAEQARYDEAGAL